MIKNELNSKVEKVAQKLKLRQLVVLQFLILTSSKSKYTSRDLIRRLGLPQTHLYRLINEFSDILEAKSEHVKIRRDLVQEIANFIKKMLPENEINNTKTIKNVLKKYKKRDQNRTVILTNLLPR